jgi:hypothetical protein
MDDSLFDILLENYVDNDIESICESCGSTKDIIRIMPNSGDGYYPVSLCSYCVLEFVDSIMNLDYDEYEDNYP